MLINDTTKICRKRSVKRNERVGFSRMHSSTAGHHNELLTIMSSYMASNERNGLSPRTRELYWLVGHLAMYTAGDFDTQYLTQDKPSNIIRCLVAFAEETASEFNAVNQALPAPCSS